MTPIMFIILGTGNNSNGQPIELIPVCGNMECHLDDKLSGKPDFGP